MNPWMLDPPILSPKEKINYSHNILFAGSCFSKSIAALMTTAKMNVMQNPNGILFDPFSIARCLKNVLTEYSCQLVDVFRNNDYWHSWDHHSSFSHYNKNALLTNLQEIRSATTEYLKKADWLVITFGTAYFYSLKEDGRKVANCHKVAGNLFDKNLATSQSIVSEYDHLISTLLKVNPSIKILFTVSPVRHIKDGVIENNRSKGRLLEAVHNLVEKHSNVFYFPAYELVIDVLRDYRFFKEDMVHPSVPAIKYVFDEFKKSYFDTESQNIFTEINNWMMQVNHKILHPLSESSKDFEKKLLDTKINLQKKYPFINFNDLSNQ